MTSVDKNGLEHWTDGNTRMWGGTFPTVFEYYTDIFLEAVFIERIGGVYDVEENVIEEVLERGDRSTLVDQ